MSFHLTLILIQEKGSENMVKVAIVGCNGKMGGYVADAVDSRDNCETLFGVDAFGTNKRDFPVYKSFDEAKEKPDVIIDFSNPAALDGMLGFALEHGVPCVICTTGHRNILFGKYVARHQPAYRAFQAGCKGVGFKL